jgi:hypothetical protein
MNWLHFMSIMRSDQRHVTFISMDKPPWKKEKCDE